MQGDLGQVGRSSMGLEGTGICQTWIKLCSFTGSEKPPEVCGQRHQTRGLQETTISVKTGLPRLQDDVHLVVHTSYIIINCHWFACPSFFLQSAESLNTSIAMEVGILDKLKDRG